MLIFSQGSGKSLSFNGSNQYINVLNLSSNLGNTDFTVECFTKFNSFSNYGGVITTLMLVQVVVGAIHQQLDGSVVFLLEMMPLLI